MLECVQGICKFGGAKLGLRRWQTANLGLNPGEPHKYKIQSSTKKGTLFVPRFLLGLDGLKRETLDLNQNLATNLRLLAILLGVWVPGFRV